MRNVTAVNRWIGVVGLVLCLLLAVLALPGWWYLRHHWVPGDAIVQTRALRPGLMLYVVRRNGGNTSVPYLYDYYLSGQRVDLSSLGSLMDRRAPFLVTDSDMADIAADGDDSVCVALRGHVFGFTNRVMLDIGKVRQSIAIAIVAQPAGRVHEPRAGPVATALRAVHSGANIGRSNDHEGGALSVCRMQP